jgi:hypothetical protein
MDPLLAATVPPDIEIHRVAAWSANWSRRIGIGNLGYRSWSAMRKAGDRLLADRRFDLVYFSTTQFIATTLGRSWLRRFRVPFVVDIQDPWSTDYYDRPGAPLPPGGWKYRFARWQAARLEGWSWRDAAGFVSVSEDYLAQLRLRYPWFAGKPADVIPFGGAEADFAFARSRTDAPAAFAREPNFQHLVSVGAVGPIMRASLRKFFAAVQELRNADPVRVSRLRLHFIGTSYATDEFARASVLPLATEFGLADVVREQTQRVGFFSAINTLLAADAIIIPGSDDHGYNPSKLSTCFLAGKPVLALAPGGSRFQRDAGNFGFTCAEVDGEGAAVSRIKTFICDLANTPIPAARPGATETGATPEHSARARTARQCDLFSRALDHQS